MTSVALTGRLKSDFDTLSVRFQEAARWVIDNPADVALLTTREQARRAGVSPATMTRLAQHFGLKGYEELRKLYADAMRRRPDNYRGRAQELLERRAAEGDPALVQDIFSSLSQHMQALSSPDAFAGSAAPPTRSRRQARVLRRPALGLFGRSIFFTMCVAVRRGLDPGGRPRRDRHRQPAQHLESRCSARGHRRPLCPRHRGHRALCQDARRADHRHHRQRSLADRHPRRPDHPCAHRNAVILSYDGAGFRGGGMPGGAGCRAPRR